MERLKKRLADLEHIASTTPISSHFTQTECQLLLSPSVSLRPYQVKGINWILECYERGHGAILGDDVSSLSLFFYSFYFIIYFWIIFLNVDGFR